MAIDPIPKGTAHNIQEIRGENNLKSTLKIVLLETIRMVKESYTN